MKHANVPRDAPGGPDKWRDESSSELRTVLWTVCIVIVSVGVISFLLHQFIPEPPNIHDPATHHGTHG
jgi:hypothetical protein